ncbi:MAG: hypothetical protein BYD32DRAFT_77517 [Podila humilis]|nr:MAG: hypothetical protein BYD32DRAFT_77517 [Podila humilis]
MGNGQSSSQNPSIERKTAVVLIGNSGVGKSTLLTQLGAKTFESGVKCRQGYTKDVIEEHVQLDGHDVVLIDVPGLYEPNDNETRLNAKKLTKALSNKTYDYKLYFVTLATNRGPLNPDLVMMSKVNQCIKKANGTRVSFRVIVNQIMAAPVYDMYQQEMAFDNFKSFFETLDKAKEIGLRGFSFEISIDSVMLLMFSESDVETNGFKDMIVADVCAHSQSAIQVKELKASNEDITLFESAVMVSWLGVPVAVAGRVAAVFLGGGMVATVAVNAGLAISAVGGTVWLLHQAYRIMNETNQTSVTEELTTEGPATKGPATKGPATEESVTEGSSRKDQSRKDQTRKDRPQKDRPQKDRPRKDQPRKDQPRKDQSWRIDHRKFSHGRISHRKFGHGRISHRKFSRGSIGHRKFSHGRIYLSTALISFSPCFVCLY